MLLYTERAKKNDNKSKGRNKTVILFASLCIVAEISIHKRTWQGNMWGLSFLMPKIQYICLYNHHNLMNSEWQSVRNELTLTHHGQ